MKGIIFDLDGTLLYTLQDLCDAVNAALRDVGLPTHALGDFRAYVGDGARMLCRRAMGMAADDDPRLDDVLARFRGYYAQYRVRTTRPYDGAAETLAALRARGMKMAILSNKPQADTEAVAAQYFPAGTFDLVLGQSEAVPPKPDPTGCRLALEALGLDPHEVAYLGDGDADMITAKNAGLLALGACWGFRDEPVLLACGADRLVRDIRELTELI